MNWPGSKVIMRGEDVGCVPHLQEAALEGQETLQQKSQRVQRSPVFLHELFSKWLLVVELKGGRKKRSQKHLGITRTGVLKLLNVVFCQQRLGPAFQICILGDCLFVRFINIFWFPGRGEGGSAHRKMGSQGELARLFLLVFSLFDLGTGGLALPHLLWVLLVLCGLTLVQLGWTLIPSVGLAWLL